MDIGVKDLYLRAIHRQIYWHLCKYGVCRRRVTLLAQNTRYNEGAKRHDMLPL
jgi:hypothetical protein